MNDFTKGPYKLLGLSLLGEHGLITGFGASGLTHDEDSANANLAYTAFNSATRCAEMGYDGQKCVEYLPKMVEILELLAPVEMSKLKAKGEKSSGLNPEPKGRE